jgi:hypothetical protein
MDFGENDRLDNKRSFAVFALRLALETLDRLEEQDGETEVIDEIDESESDISQMDPASEQWEGSMTWEVEDTTVAEEIQKVDLASLTDWDE